MKTLVSSNLCHRRVLILIASLIWLLLRTFSLSPISMVTRNQISFFGNENLDNRTLFYCVHKQWGQTKTQTERKTFTTNLPRPPYINITPFEKVQVLNYLTLVTIKDGALLFLEGEHFFILPLTYINDNSLPSVIYIEYYIFPIRTVMNESNMNLLLISHSHRFCAINFRILLHVLQRPCVIASCFFIFLPFLLSVLQYKVLMNRK